MPSFPLLSQKTNQPYLTRPPFCEFLSLILRTTECTFLAVWPPARSPEWKLLVSQRVHCTTSRHTLAVAHVENQQSRAMLTSEFEVLTWPENLFQHIPQLRPPSCIQRQEWLMPHIVLFRSYEIHILFVCIVWAGGTPAFTGVCEFLILVLGKNNAAIYHGKALTVVVFWVPTFSMKTIWLINRLGLRGLKLPMFNGCLHLLLASFSFGTQVSAGFRNLAR